MVRSLFATVLVACTFVTTVLVFVSAHSVSPSSSAQVSPLSSIDPSLEPFLLAQWEWIDFAFTDPSAAAAYVDNKMYQNVVLTGVKKWRPPASALVAGTQPLTIVTTPRWKSGVPATVSWVDFSSVGRGAGPLLHPFPSWDANTPGDASRFQSVLGLEIDAFNRVWIVDQGRIEGGVAQPGAIKIVIYDLLLQQEVQRHSFPSWVASPANSFLNDIVLDQPRGMAYITDTGIPSSGLDADFEGGIVVFDFNQPLDSLKSWRMLHRHRSTQPNFSFRFQVQGKDVLPGKPLMAGADGVALSPDGLFLFYTSLSSRDLWRVATCWLRGNVSANVIANEVVHVLMKPGASDGMTMTFHQGPSPSPLPPSAGICPAAELVGAPSYELLISDIEHAMVWAYVGDLSRAADNSTTAPKVNPVVLVHDDAGMQWPDTFAFGGDGAVLFTSNHLNLFQDGSMDFTQPNFRIWQIIPTPTTPRYSYLSLPRQADTFVYYESPQNPCEGIPTAIHVLTQGANECLYTPNDGNSFSMGCVFDETSGETMAQFDAFTGPGCAAGSSFGSGTIPGNTTCAKLDPTHPANTVSATATCHQTVQPVVPSQAEGYHAFVWHGYVGSCSRPPVAVQHVSDGSCFSVPSDGFFVQIQCNSAGVAHFGVFLDSACSAGKEYSSGFGLGDGQNCISVMSATNAPVRVGAATVTCGALPSPPVCPGGDNNGGGGVKVGVVVLLVFIFFFLGGILASAVAKYRARKVDSSDSGAIGYAHMP